MSSSFDTTDRFLRPFDVGRIRRNQRRIQMQRLLGIGRNVTFVLVVLAAGAWVYRETQSDARFAVRHITVTGARHTPRVPLEQITRRYAGTNLFRIDIDRVRQDLAVLSWINGVEIEKKLPDTLRIAVTERQPVALHQKGDRFLYVDAAGVAFAELSPQVGNEELPVILDEENDGLRRAIAFLRDLRTRDPQLFSRLSQIRSIPPRGFAIFDRDLHAWIYANEESAIPKWRALYSIVGAEGLERASIEYADLRFVERIVVKPLHALPKSGPALHAAPPVQITN